MAPPANRFADFAEPETQASANRFSDFAPANPEAAGQGGKSAAPPNRFADFATPGPPGTSSAPAPNRFADFAQPPADPDNPPGTMVSRALSGFPAAVERGALRFENALSKAGEAVMGRIPFIGDSIKTEEQNLQAANQQRIQGLPAPANQNFGGRLIDTVTESAFVAIPTMAIAAQTGGLGLGAVAATAGVGSGLTEYANAEDEYLATVAKVDLANPDAVRAAKANPAIASAAREWAAKRGAVVGAVDAATMGAAGRYARPLLAAGRPAAAAATGLGIEAAGGAGGEAAAQLATEGRITDPEAIVMEAAAELIPGSVELASALRSSSPAPRSPLPAPRSPPNRFADFSGQDTPTPGTPGTPAQPQAQVPAPSEASVQPAPPSVESVPPPQPTPAAAGQGDMSVAPPQPYAPIGDSALRRPTLAARELPIADPTPFDTAPDPRRWTARTPDGVINATGIWDVVDAGALVPSDNPAFPVALQPRNRSSVASQAQVERIAQSLSPDMLGPDAMTDAGAPIVSPDNLVLSGNGRFMGIRRAMQAYPDRAAAYHAAVRNIATTQGIDTAGMANPVLVRRLDPRGIDAPDFVERSNRSRILARSPAELAESDAKTITDNNLAELYTPDESGSALAASNRDFVTGFVQATGATELLDTTGRPTADAEIRIKRAMLSALTGTGEQARAVTHELIQRPDELGIKNQVNALMSTAGRLAKVGKLKPDYDLRPHFAQALKDLVEYRRSSGTYATPDAFLAQQDMFGTSRTEESIALFNAMATAKSAVDLRGKIERYLAQAEAIDTTTADIFGEPNATANQLIARSFAPQAAPVAQGNRPPSPPPPASRAGDQSPQPPPGPGLQLTAADLTGRGGTPAALPSGQAQSLPAPAVKDSLTAPQPVPSVPSTVSPDTPVTGTPTTPDVPVTGTSPANRFADLAPPAAAASPAPSVPSDPSVPSTTTQITHGNTTGLTPSPGISSDVSWLANLWTTLATAQGNLGRAVFRLREASDSLQSSLRMQASQNIGRLRAEVRRMAGIGLLPSSFQARQRIMQQVNDALTDPTGYTLGTLPAPLRPIVRDMRNNIDALSLRMVNEGIAAGPAAATVINNIGSYLNRSYRIFSDPSYKPTRDAINRVYGLTRRQMPRNPGESDVDYDTRIATAVEMLTSRGRDETATQRLERVVIGLQNNGILKRRGNIPIEIRQLWGEYTEGDLNYMNTIGKMANLIANQKFLADTYATGLGDFIHDQPTVGHTVRISEPNDPRMGALAGKYTTREFADAIADIVTPEHQPAWLKMYMRANGAVKLAKTVLDPATQIRNFLANPLIILRNGHFPFANGTVAFKTILADILPSNMLDVLQRRTGYDRARWEAQLREYTELNVIGPGANSGEILATMQDAMGGQVTMDDFVANRAKRIAAAPFALAARIYQASDAFFKIINYHAELNVMQQASPARPLAEMKADASELTRQITPTYGRVPGIVTAIRKFPFMGTFVSFPAEMLRTTANTLRHARTEIKSGNPVLVKMGYKRIAGTVAAHALPTLAAGIARYACGVDDEDDDALRTLAAPWDKNAELLMLGKNDAGQARFVNLSAYDPFYYKKALRALFREDLNEREKAVESLGEIFGPFVSEDILTAALIDIRRNRNGDTGSAIHPETATWDEAFTANLEHVWNKALRPGAIRHVENIAKAARGEVGRFGKVYSVQDEISTAMGVRVQTIDPLQNASFALSTFRRNKLDAQQRFTRTAANQGTVSTEDLALALARTMSGRREAYQAAIDATRAASRLGIDAPTIAAKAKAQGLSRSDIESILSGTIPDYQLSDETLANISAASPDRLQQLQAAVPRALQLMAEMP